MIPRHNTAGTPILLADAGPRLLQRVTLGAGRHSEAWLQQLIFEKPELLPVSAIEPAFDTLVPVACEVPCAHGFIDNVYVTPRGDVVLVEAKLWRNPQSRRELVAQTLDYVAALMSLSYHEFEAALRRGAPSRLTGSLYQLIAEHPDAVDEASFIDVVARNLARGRMLALAVGDGIRAETHALAALLQSHAGAHFTFALVELGFWSEPGSGNMLCVPNTLAQTVMIERGIVTVENDAIVVRPMPAAVTARAAPHSISDAVFAEQLAAVDPALPRLLRDFTDALAPYGVYADQKGSLVLRAQGNGAKPLNLGAIDKAGRLWTDHVHNSLPAALARRYNEDLAALIDGCVPADGPPRLTTNGRSAPLVTALLPTHASAWAAIIADLLRDVARQDERDVA